MLCYAIPCYAMPWPGSTGSRRGHQEIKIIESSVLFSPRATGRGKLVGDAGSGFSC